MKIKMAITKVELANMLLGVESTKKAASKIKTSTIVGTAHDDSHDGYVLVDLGGDAISVDGQQYVSLATTSDVRAGDKVYVMLRGADGTAMGATVIGSAGGGDRTKGDIAKANSNASTAVSTAKTAATDAAEAKAETKDLVMLRIDSSRGTVFKNSEVSTVLTVRCWKRGEEITTLTALRDAMGDQTARIRWYVLRDGDTDWVSLADSDEKLSEDGFALTLKPSDIDIKCTFKAEVVTD